MKYIIIILINSFLFANLLMAEKFCESQANCLIVTSDKTNKASDTLSCKLISLNTLTMKANHVLTKEGKLKHYWDDNKTVCDVLGWINDGINSINKIDGIVTSLNTPTTINLNLKHVFGQLTANSYKGLQLDIDIDKQGEKGIDYIDDFSVETCSFDDDFCDAVSDGNDLVSVRPFQTVHEMFHFMQERTTATLKHKWVNEGTARMFEDVVYDDGNSYLKEAYTPFYRKPYIPNILENLISDESAYKTFGIWKLLQEKCTLDMKKMLTEPLINFNTIAKSCTELPNILEDKLANLFLYYNWAILYKGDFSLIDSNEPKVNLLPKRLEKINNKDFKGTLDMKYILNGTIPAYGAKSFLITHETLSSDGNMNLTFKASGDLKLVAIRVKADGNSDVTDNFILDSSKQEHNLSKLDRTGGLFVTLTNTTEKEIELLDLNLTKIRFSRNDETNIVTDHKTNLMWKDNNRSEEEVMSFYAARNYCSNLDYSGYTDWRLPFITELENLVFYDAVKEKSKISSKFKNIQELMYWSSNVYNDPGSAYDKAGAYYFYNFNRYEYDVRTTLSVVCVRDKN